MEKKLSFKEMAVNTEREHARFYRRMQERVREQRCKDLLDFLAGEEEKHAQDLEAIISDGGNAEILERAFSEVKGQLPFLGDRPADPDVVAQSLGSEEEILRYALEAEERSIELYGTLAKQLSCEKLTGQILALEKEERNHRENIAGILRLEERSGEDPLGNQDDAEAKLREAGRQDEERKGRRKEEE